MPSLTPLHETYCKWDRTPPSQADVLEGLAQLFSTSLNGVHELIQVINIEVLKNAFGISAQNAKNFQKRPFVQKLYQFSYGALQKYGSHFLAPSLRHIIEKYPTLHEKPLTPSQHFLVGILNGIFGDYLLKQHSPLALPMVLYDHYGAIQQGELAGRIVILAHGLCMNHLTWSNAHYGGIGERLLAQRDHNTMLYLNYNTGRRISANGRSFSNLLEDLVQRNPRITSIDIIGHSMGGHGALMIALRNPQRYASVSAFSPIVAPSQVPWGQKAFSAYLGDDQSTWANYDSLAWMKQSAHSKKLPLLIDQGSGDEFLAEQLKPERFAQAAKDANYPMTLRMQDGYDHSYYFISSFIADHFVHHAAALQA